MTLDEFKASLDTATAPPDLGNALAALWQDAKGEWDAAHELAQSVSDADGAWVHAYLHRKEGDLNNASYWYRRAGKDRPDGALASEWEQIAAALLGKSAKS